MKSKEAVSKLKLKKPPVTEQENYQHLTTVWQQKNMCEFKDFLRRYNNKGVVPPLEAMQKMVGFYHNKRNDMLKLGCTLPNLANICLHKSTTAKFCPFTENDKDFLAKFLTTWLMDYPLFLHGKLLWTRLLFGIGQTCETID